MDPGARPNMAQLLQEFVFDDSGKSKKHICPIVPITISQENLYTTTNKLVFKWRLTIIFIVNVVRSEHVLMLIGLAKHEP